MKLILLLKEAFEAHRAKAYVTCDKTCFCWQVEILIAEYFSSKKPLISKYDRMEAALQRIAAWQKAYPVSVFPEPDWELAHAALKAYGARLDDISASNIRHVLNQIKEIVEEALR